MLCLINCLVLIIILSLIVSGNPTLIDTHMGLAFSGFPFVWIYLIYLFVLPYKKLDEVIPISGKLTCREIEEKERKIYRENMAEIENAMGKCRNCKSSINRNYKYCERCGVEL